MSFQISLPVGMKFLRVAVGGLVAAIVLGIIFVLSPTVEVLAWEVPGLFIGLNAILGVLLGLTACY